MNRAAPSSTRGADLALAAGVAAVLLLHGVVWVTGGLATLVHRGTWHPPAGRAVTGVLLGWAGQPLHGRLVFPAGGRDQLPTDPVLLALLLTVLLAAVLGGLAAVRLGQRLLAAAGDGLAGGPAGAGFASRHRHPPASGREGGAGPGPAHPAVAVRTAGRGP